MKLGADRVRPLSTIESDARRIHEIVSLLEKEDGISPKEIEMMANVSWSTQRRILLILEREKIAIRDKGTRSRVRKWRLSPEFKSGSLKFDPGQIAKRAVV